MNNNQNDTLLSLIGRAKNKSEKIYGIPENGCIDCKYFYTKTKLISLIYEDGLTFAKIAKMNQKEFNQNQNYRKNVLIEIYSLFRYLRINTKIDDITSITISDSPDFIIELVTGKKIGLEVTNVSPVGSQSFELKKKKLRKKNLPVWLANGVYDDDWLISNEWKNNVWNMCKHFSNENRYKNKSGCGIIHYFLFDYDSALSENAEAINFICDKSMIKPTSVFYENWVCSILGIHRMNKNKMQTIEKEIFDFNKTTNYKTRP